MNVDLNDTHLMIRDMARKFAQEELAPTVLERDEKEEFPTEAVKKMGDLGLMGMMTYPAFIVSNIGNARIPCRFLFFRLRF